MTKASYLCQNCIHFNLTWNDEPCKSCAADIWSMYKGFSRDYSDDGYWVIQ